MNNVEKTINVTIKSVYGKETIYPACENAKIFARLSNCKTLTASTIADINALGYTVTVLPAEAKTL